MPTNLQRHPRVPKYIKVAEQLRAQVQSGNLKPGDRLPSFVELRDHHQISRGTVEKVHALLERDGLIVREQGRGVFVGSAQRREATGIIGFAGQGFAEVQSSLYWAHLVQGIQAEAAREKMQLLLLNSPFHGELWDKVDGVLLGVNEEDLHAQLRHVPPSLPCVSMLTSAEGVAGVLADDYQGARDATRHLLALGHQRIGHLVAGHNSLIERRLSGYRDALSEAAIEPELRWMRQLRLRARRADSKLEFIEQGRRCVREWLASDWKQAGCTAILTQNDHVAVGAIQSFQEASVRVPEDVSVAGFDGTEMYDFFSPRLTTVKVPLHHIGAVAMRLLLEKIKSGNIRQQQETIMLPTHLKEGTSTAPAKISPSQF